MVLGEIVMESARGRLESPLVGFLEQSSLVAVAVNASNVTISRSKEKRLLTNTDKGTT